MAKRRAAILLLGLAAWPLAFAEARPGGRLVVGQRTEPRTFNPVLEIDEPSRTVNGLLHSALLRTDPVSGRMEAALAESWKVSGEGTRIAVRLRPALRFADGHPLTVADVLFSFEAFGDATVAAPQRELLIFAGKPVSVRATGERELSFVLPGTTALGERMLSGIPVLPRHLLEAAYRRGELRSAWGTGTRPAGIAGAGPFRLARIEPGRRLVLSRNPSYWRCDAAGRPLPYLDEIEFVFAASEDLLIARVLAGEVDAVAGLGSGPFETLRRSPGAGKLRVSDLGASLDYTLLLFNLNPGAATAAHARRKEWFADPRFRRAMSLAIDRAAIARLAYGGRATPLWGHVTPARTGWFDRSVPRPARNPGGARALLREAGFGWTEEGRLRDRSGAPVEFTIAASSSNPAYGRTAAIVEQDLREIGVAAQVVALEFRSLLERVTDRKDFDTAIMAIRPGEADPIADMNVLLSSGKAHLWNLGGRPESWETEIDGLLRQQASVADPARRFDLFRRAQRILSDQMPFLSLVSPNVLIAARYGLEGLAAAPGGNPIASNADSLRWAGSVR